MVGQQSCGTCTFFHAFRDSADIYARAPEPETKPWGVCRRYPPVPSDRINRQQDNLVEIIGRWPIVERVMWCGEYREEIT